MVRRKYAENSIVGFGSYANQALNIVPSGTGPNQRIGRTIVVKEIEIKINMQAAWAMSEPQSLQPLASVIVSISFWTSKQTGRCPLEPTSTTHSLPVYLPKIRFMNLLSSDRFSLVKRWEERH